MEAKASALLLLSVPLSRRDDIIALLTVYTSDPRVFPDEEVAFVEAVADLGAQALANARFCEWVRRKDIEIPPDLVEWYSLWAQK